jgi:2-amino-4-hydroxy-6-hydroxymethyldihydropteridine diphosphokinase
MSRAGIALGTNLGDKTANLRAALALLESIATPGEPVLTAPVYRTEPLLCPPDSPDFYNTVVEIHFKGSAQDLLAKTRQFENQLGRTRGSTRNAPRLIDIDLLYLGDESHETPDLTLPHPRFHERRFVLQPLADIRPQLILPGQTRSIAELLETLETDEPPLAIIAPAH